MKTVKITPLMKEINVHFTGKDVQLPQDIQTKIDEHWTKLIANGRPYQRGEVFTITKREETKNTINLVVERSDYAHFLYSRDVGLLGMHSIYTIHTAALVETYDGYLVFGKMGQQTAQAGHYQSCGGGIDNDDLRGEYLDLEHNITKELEEELGIVVSQRERVKKIQMAYLKEGGPTKKIGVIFRISLNETKDVFLKKYKVFEKELLDRGEIPEFSEIIVLKKEGDEIDVFLKDCDNTFEGTLYPLLQYIHLGNNK